MGSPASGDTKAYYSPVFDPVDGRAYLVALDAKGVKAVNPSDTAPHGGGPAGTADTGKSARMKDGTYVRLYEVTDETLKQNLHTFSNKVRGGYETAAGGTVEYKAGSLRSGMDGKNLTMDGALPLTQSDLDIIKGGPKTADNPYVRPGGDWPPRYQMARTDKDTPNPQHQKTNTQMAAQHKNARAAAVDYEQRVNIALSEAKTDAIFAQHYENMRLILKAESQMGGGAALAGMQANLDTRIAAFNAEHPRDSNDPQAHQHLAQVADDAMRARSRPHKPDQLPEKLASHKPATHAAPAPHADMHRGLASVGVSDEAQYTPARPMYSPPEAASAAPQRSDGFMGTTAPEMTSASGYGAFGQPQPNSSALRRHLADRMGLAGDVSPAVLASRLNAIAHHTPARNAENPVAFRRSTTVMGATGMDETPPPPVASTGIFDPSQKEDPRIIGSANPNHHSVRERIEQGAGHGGVIDGRALALTSSDGTHVRMPSNEKDGIVEFITKLGVELKNGILSIFDLSNREWSSNKATRDGHVVTGMADKAHAFKEIKIAVGDGPVTIEGLEPGVNLRVQSDGSREMRINNPHQNRILHATRDGEKPGHVTERNGADAPADLAHLGKGTGGAHSLPDGLSWSIPSRPRNGRDPRGQT